jgi:TonB-dependent Receptor Plug Domain
VTRAVLVAAAVLAVAHRAAAQGDTLVRDTTRADTVAAVLAAPPARVPPGPLPRGTRYVFTADSFAFSNTKTLSDVLARVPGVYVARGGLYGQAEAVLYGGRGPAALEVYWDGVRYLPVGRDSVYLDPARIPLAPLERVEVVVLPAVLRVYLVTRRQRSTAPTSAIGVTTGQFGTAGYQGAFLKRWRSGTGLSLVADWNDITGPGGSSTTPFHDVDLWLGAEYVPRAGLGASLQLVSADWHRSGSTAPLVEDFRSRRLDRLLHVFVGGRPDGLGSRLDLTVATTSVSNDTAVPPRSLTQGALAFSSVARRAATVVTARVGPHRSPFELDAQASWMPVPPVTLAVDAGHTAYTSGRSGNRAHLALGVTLPLGLSAHGDLAWARDLAAPTLAADSLQRTTDLSAGLRWDRSWVTVEVGAARRDAFAPPDGFLTGLPSVSALTPTPTTDYVTVHGSVRPLPGLSLSGWYFDPVRGGADFEPPRHGRYAVSFYSKFWRVYRSGVFALHLEGAAESWSRGAGAGVAQDASGTTTPLALLGGTFVDVNLEVRVVGVTIFWQIRNARAFRGSYVPGVDYPRNYQYYGVAWRFTN